MGKRRDGKVVWGRGGEVEREVSKAAGGGYEEVAGSHLGGSGQNNP